jgi:hypothetical protein
MKRVLLYGGLLLFMGIGIVSCYQDVILPPASSTAPPQFVSYSGDLQPLWTSNCALPTCHVPGGQNPYLTEGISYDALIGGGYVNTVVPEDSKLIIAINGIMLSHIPNAADRQKVTDWVKNGAPNN